MLLALGHHSPETWTAIGTLALAGATVLLATVAIFAEPLRRRFSRASLEVEIRTQPPDMHQIEMRNVATGAAGGMALYSRIRVANVGTSAAENVEVLASNVWTLRGRQRELLASFLPMSLTWSHFQPPTSVVRIPVGAFRHCDLGRFQEQPSVGSTLFVMSTIVQPNPVARGEIPFVLRPGTYLIELTVGGDNVKPLTKTWKLEFGPPWSNDEATMLGQVTLAEYSD